MKKKLLELLEVRNLISILVTLTFIVLCFTGVIAPNLIEYVVISVFGALYGAKKVVEDKKVKEDDKDGQ